MPSSAENPYAHAAADDAVVVVHVDDAEPVELPRALIAAARRDPTIAADRPTLRAYLEAVPADADVPPTAPA